MSPFSQLVERFYPEFEALYEERYQERYGFWRPIIAPAVAKFLECGDLKQIWCGRFNHSHAQAGPCRCDHSRLSRAGNPRRFTRS